MDAVATARDLPEVFRTVGAAARLIIRRRDELAAPASTAESIGRRRKRTCGDRTGDIAVHRCRAVGRTREITWRKLVLDAGRFRRTTRCAAWSARGGEDGAVNLLLALSDRGLDRHPCQRDDDRQRRCGSHGGDLRSVIGRTGIDQGRDRRAAGYAGRDRDVPAVDPVRPETRDDPVVGRLRRRGRPAGVLLEHGGVGPGLQQGRRHRRGVCGDARGRPECHRTRHRPRRRASGSGVRPARCEDLDLDSGLPARCREYEGLAARPLATQVLGNSTSPGRSC